MLAARNLEKLIELESDLKTQYQTQLDAKSAQIDAGSKVQEEQKATIARQLEQIKELSATATANKHTEQLNRELNETCRNLQEDLAERKKRLKTLQKDLAEERAELKALKQFDPARMKKNLDSNKKKLAEKTKATDLLQKSLNKSKTESAEYQRTIKELEEKLASLEEEAPAEAPAEAEIE